MADVSIIKLPSGSSYDMKDATARSALSAVQSDISTLKTAVAGKAEHDFFRTGTKLENGTDLDSLTTIGSYYSESNTTSESMLNIPDYTKIGATGLGGFRLDVFYRSSPFQISQVMYINWGDDYIFYRGCGSEGAFREWRYIPTESVGNRNTENNTNSTIQEEEVI